MLTLVYSADGSKLVAVYNNGNLAKKAPGGMTEGDVLKLLGYHGKAILNPDFEDEDMNIPLILPKEYDKFQNYNF